MSFSILTFAIPPDQANYTTLANRAALGVKFDSGVSAFRKNVDGTYFPVTVSWTTDNLGYKYIRAFYRTGVNSGSFPFLINLLLDGADSLTLHKAYFVPNTFKMTINGARFTVGYTLMVSPINS